MAREPPCPTPPSLAATVGHVSPASDRRAPRGEPRSTLLDGHPVAADRNLALVVGTHVNERDALADARSSAADTHMA